MNKPLYKTIRKLLKNINELLEFYLKNKDTVFPLSRNMMKQDKSEMKSNNDEIEEQLKKIKVV